MSNSRGVVRAQTDETRIPSGRKGAGRAPALSPMFGEESLGGFVPLQAWRSQGETLRRRAVARRGDRSGR